MPSFCCPLVFGPKPVMIRPRTGQRKLVEEPPVVPVGADSGSGSATGVTTCVLCTGSVCATFGAGALIVFAADGVSGLLTTRCAGAATGATGCACATCAGRCCCTGAA